MSHQNLGAYFLIDHADSREMFREHSGRTIREGYQVISLPLIVQLDGDSKHKQHVEGIGNYYHLLCNGTTFENAFDMSNPKHMYTVALIQTIQRAVDKYLVMHKSKKEVSTASDPVVMDIEVCTDTDEVVDEEADSQNVFSRSAQDRLFMKGVPRTAEIVMYRLNVFVLESLIDLAAIVFDIINENEVLFNKVVYNISAKTTNSEDDGRNNMLKFQGHGDQSKNYGRSLSKNEKYKLICNREVWCNVVDEFTGLEYLTEPARRKEVLNYSKMKDNPGHIARAFNPVFTFKYMTPVYVAASQRDLSSYYSNKTWKYPKPDHVITLNQKSRRTLFDHFLPYYQVRFHPIPESHKRRRVEIAPPVAQVQNDVEGADPCSDDDDFFDAPPIDALQIGGGDFTSLFQEPTVREDEDGQQYYVAYNSTYLASTSFQDLNTLDGQAEFHDTTRPTSNFHVLINEGRRLSSLISLHHHEGVARDVLRAELLAKQELLSRWYMDQCMRSESDVSYVAKKINKWMETTPRPSGFGGYRPHMFVNLSTFGNMLVRDFEALESLFFTSYLHTHTTFVFYTFRACYQHMLDTLYINVAQFGEPSTGKSRVLTLLYKVFIPGTMNKAGMNWSEEARYVDGPRNDEVYLTDEMPFEMMTDNKNHGGNVKKEERIKSMLTENAVFKTVTVVMPNGLRTNRIISSEQICTFIMNSNKPPWMISDAIRDRLHLLMIHFRFRPGRTISALMSAEERMTDTQKQHRSTYIMWKRLQQAFHLHIEKQIAIGALTDINYTAFTMSKDKIIDYLSDNYMIEVPPRQIMKMHKVVRCFVISTVMEYVFSNPLSPHHNEDYNPVKHNAYIDPLLHDNMEIVCAVWRSFKSQFINDDHLIVQQALREMYVTPMLDKLFKNVQIINDEMVFPLGHEACVKEYFLTALTAHDEASDGSRIKICTDQTQHYAYLCIKSDVKELIDAVHAHLSRSTHHMSSGTVKSVIFSLMNIDKLGLCATYNWDTATHLPRRTATKKPMAKMYKSYEYLLIHLDLLRNCVDPIDEAIRQTYNIHQQYDEDYLDFGVEVHPHLPHINKIREIRTGHGKQLQYTEYAQIKTNVTQLAFLEQGAESVVDDSNLDDGSRDILRSYDDLSCKERRNLLFLPMTKGDWDEVPLDDVDPEELVDDIECPTSWRKFEVHAKSNYCVGKNMQYPRNAMRANNLHFASVVKPRTKDMFDIHVYGER